MSLDGGRIDWREVRRRLAEGERALTASLEDDDALSRAVLDRRAANLARETVRVRRGGDVTLLALGLGRERYALALTALAGVTRPRPLSPTVEGRPSLLGALFERGEIWAIHDLGELLRVPRDDTAPADARYVLMRRQGSPIGFRVDRVEGLVSLDRAEMQRLASERQGSAAPVLGVTLEGISILDAAALRGRAVPAGEM
jgi:chemotaxis signal transduction protein